MEKHLLFLGSDCHNKKFSQEVQDALQFLKKQKTDSGTENLKLSSLEICFCSSSSDFRVVEKVYNLNECSDVVRSNEEESEKSPGTESQQNLYIFNNFFKLSEALHNTADSLGPPGKFFLSVLWFPGSYLPCPSETLEFYGALRRLLQWHFGALYVITEDAGSLSAWASVLSFYTSSSTYKVLEVAMSTLWRGSLGFSIEGQDGMELSPEFTLCSEYSLPFFPACDIGKEDAVYVHPVAEVVTRIDMSTVPWVYIQQGGLCSLFPSFHIDQDEQKQCSDVIQSLTRCLGDATLFRIRYSTEPLKVLMDVPALTTEEWKKNTVEGNFSLQVEFQLPKFYCTRNCLLLPNGYNRNRAFVAVLKESSSISDDIWRMARNSFIESQDSTCEIDKNTVKQFLKETPCFSSLNGTTFSHLSVGLPAKVKEALQKHGRNLDKISEVYKSQIEAACSQQVLQTMLPDVSYFTLTSGIEEIQSEVDVSSKEWPEYKALDEEALRKQKSIGRYQSGKLLGGLTNPSSDSVLNLKAEELVHFFDKQGHAAESVAQQMVKSRFRSSRFHPFISYQQAKTTTWPEAFNLKYHGIHYNYNEKSEEFEAKCNQILEKYIQHESASICTIFQDKDTSVAGSKHALGKENPHPLEKDNLPLHIRAPKRRLSESDSVSIRSGSTVKRRKEEGTPKKNTFLVNQVLRRSPRKLSGVRSLGNLHHEVRASDLLSSKAVKSGTKAIPSFKQVRAPKAAELSQIHRQKLRVAVVIALESEGIKMKNPLFKVCFKKLFTICQPFVLDIIGLGRTSYHMEKIARSHVKNVIEFEKEKWKR